MIDGKPKDNQNEFSLIKLNNSCFPTVL